LAASEKNKTAYQIACYQQAETVHIVDNRVSFKIVSTDSPHPVISRKTDFRHILLDGTNSILSLKNAKKLFFFKFSAAA